MNITDVRQKVDKHNLKGASHDVDTLDEWTVFRVGIRPRVSHMFQKVDKSCECEYVPQVVP